MASDLRTSVSSFPLKVLELFMIRQTIQEGLFWAVRTQMLVIMCPMPRKMMALVLIWTNVESAVDLVSLKALVIVKAMLRTNAEFAAAMVLKQVMIAMAFV